MKNKSKGLKKTGMMCLVILVVTVFVGCRTHKRIPVSYREFSLIDSSESRQLLLGTFYQKSQNFQAATDLVRLLERRLVRDSVFESVVSAVEVLSIPNDINDLESVMRLLENQDWRKKHPNTEADLLLVGVVAYSTRDRSGYDSEWRETRYGYRVPQKIYRNRIAFDLDLGFVLVDLKSGGIVFRNTYEDDGQVEGAADEISIYFDLISEQTDEFLSEILGKKEKSYRYLVYN